MLADANTGERIREFRIESKLDQYSVSANGEWLVVANEQGLLYCFEVRTGNLVNGSREKIDSLTRLTITNDGNYVYTTEFTAALRRWNTRSNTLMEVASIRGQARSLFVSADGKRLA